MKTMATRPARPLKHTISTSTAAGLVATTLLALAGCADDRDGIAEYRAMEADLVKKHRPALSARLDKLRAVQAAAAKRPALTPLSPPSAPSSAALLGFTENEVLDRRFDASEPLTGCTFHFGNDTFAKLSGAVGFWPTKDVSPGPEKRTELEGEMTRLETPAHAVVCVQLAAEKPSLAGEGFTGGTYKAECRVFEIETAKYMGGFEASARMHEAFVNTRGAAANDLENAYESKVQDEMDSKLEAFGKAPSVYCRF